MAESRRNGEWFREMIWSAATHPEWRHPSGLEDEIEDILEFLSEDSERQCAQFDLRRGGTYVLLNFRDNEEKTIWGMLEVPISGAPEYVIEKGLMAQRYTTYRSRSTTGLNRSILRGILTP